MTRYRERIWDKTNQIREQDEHEHRKHKREEFHSLGSSRGTDRVGHELVGELGDQLSPSRHERGSCSRADEQRRNASDCNQHIEGRIRERDLMHTNGAKRKELIYLELVDRIFHSPTIPKASAILLTGTRNDNDRSQLFH